MNKLCIAGIVAGTVLGFAPAANAAHEPFGFLCGFASNEDPQVEGSETGEVDGGPLVIKDTATPGLETGSITCTIQVNAPTHSGADACGVTGPNTPAVVTAAGLCTYAVQPGDNVYLCTEVTVDGHGTLYYNDSNDPLVEGSWSSDPATANCGLATSVET